MSDEFDPKERMHRLEARAADLGTTLDYQDPKSYPTLSSQLQRFSLMAAPTNKLLKKPELTGQEIAEMRSLMDDHGDAPKSEGIVVIRAEAEIDEQEEAPAPEPCPECGRWADDYAGSRDCPDGFLLCCPGGHRWKATR